MREFYFELPQELIAQHPPAERGGSRMLVVERRPAPESPVLTDSEFRELPSWLRRGDVLVLNDSRVLPSRLFAVRSGALTQAKSPAPTGKVEVLLAEQLGVDGGGLVWRALCRPAKKVVPGERLLFFDPAKDGGPVLTAEVVSLGCYGERVLRFAPVEDFYGVVSRIGHMPLPPYIRREQAHATAQDKDEAEDNERYQTVYAQDPRVAPPGSAAAPTAGLHFTPEILAKLRERGVEIASVTLHVGLGTFQPVRVEQVKDIKLHSERYTLPPETADAINRAKAGGRRVIAVGTTTTRTLEHAAQLASGGPLEAHSGSTSIFIGPGYRFRVISGLLTNFHLPESTLLMLVSAFAAANTPLDPDLGRRSILAAYAHAVEQRYRFFSYGDCMLVV